MIKRLHLSLLATLLGFSAIGLVTSENTTLTAKEFTDTEAGAVPYYFDPQREALAINAAIEDHREKFARASVVFKGPSGTYTVTINAMRETDGDCTYRLLVDGRVVRTATNDETEIDYALQKHRFAGVKIKSGASLSIESNAVTNGKIPESDGTAFARGRWTSVTVESQ